MQVLTEGGSRLFSHSTEWRNWSLHQIGKKNQNKTKPNTVHNYMTIWGHLVTALMDLWSGSLFLKAAQVNKKQWELMSYINTPIKQSLILCYKWINAKAKGWFSFYVHTFLITIKQHVEAWCRESWVITWYISVSYYCSETKHSE